MEEFLKLMTQILDTETELAMEYPLADILEWDSLGMISFMGMADVTYHKKITLVDLASTKTIGDLFKLVS